MLFLHCRRKLSVYRSLWGEPTDTVFTYNNKLVSISIPHTHSSASWCKIKLLTIDAFCSSAGVWCHCDAELWLTVWPSAVRLLPPVKVKRWTVLMFTALLIHSPSPASGCQSHPLMRRIQSTLWSWIIISWFMWQSPMADSPVEAGGAAKSRRWKSKVSHGWHEFSLEETMSAMATTQILRPSSWFITRLFHHFFNLKSSKVEMWRCSDPSDEKHSVVSLWNFHLLLSELWRAARWFSEMEKLNCRRLAEIKLHLELRHCRSLEVKTSLKPEASWRLMTHPCTICC